VAAGAGGIVETTATGGLGEIDGDEIDGDEFGSADAGGVAACVVIPA